MSRRRQLEHEVSVAQERIKKADIVIENNTSLEELYEKVERFCEKI